MSLGIALKNRSAVVMAIDLTSDALNPGTSHFIKLPNRNVIVITGAPPHIRDLIMHAALPQISTSSSAAAVAQYIHAALVLHITPIMSQLNERLEVIIGGIDPVRHVHMPNLYYFDSTVGFRIDMQERDAVLAGLAPVASEILAERSFADTPTEALESLAKECFTATKLRWPAAIAPHLRFAVITNSSFTIQDY